MYWNNFVLKYVVFSSFLCILDKDEDVLETQLVNEDNFLKLVPVGQHAIGCTSDLCANICSALGFPNSNCKDSQTCECSN